VTIKIQKSKCFVEKTHRHFDRSGTECREVEKSIQKLISRLAYGSLEMTFCTLFYKANAKCKIEEVIRRRWIPQFLFFIFYF